MDTVHFKITRKQKAFINATADEVMFGGAAGGGKSYGQLIDAFLFAMKYPGSKQLILSLIHISEPTRHMHVSRMPSSA